jgi:hypothetical protein
MNFRADKRVPFPRRIVSRRRNRDASLEFLMSVSAKADAADRRKEENDSATGSQYTVGRRRKILTLASRFHKTCR